MQKKIKCKQCGQYFMWTSIDKKCRFCHTVYGEIEEKPKDKKVTAKVRVEEKDKDKKVIAKNIKESFKIWKDN